VEGLRMTTGVPYRMVSLMFRTVALCWCLTDKYRSRNLRSQYQASVSSGPAWSSSCEFIHNSFSFCREDRFLSATKRKKKIQDTIFVKHASELKFILNISCIRYVMGSKKRLYRKHRSNFSVFHEFSNIVLNTFLSPVLVRVKHEVQTKYTWTRLERIHTFILCTFAFWILLSKHVPVLN
jgi:hypothetical protein